MKELCRSELKARGIQPTSEAVSVLLRRIAHPFYSWCAIPEGDQKDFISDTKSAVGSGGVYVLFGGNRSGKTESGAYAVAHLALVGLSDIASERLKLGLRTPVWVSGVTYELVGNVCWGEKLSRLIPRDSIETDGISWRNKGKGWPSSIRLKNGVELHFKSYDQGRETYQAASIFGAWCDEQHPDDVLQELRMRCVDHAAPIYLTQTPINPDPAMQARVEQGPEGWRFYSIDIEDNRKSRGGHLPDIEVDKILAQMMEESPELYETRKSGAFAGFSGAIFKSFRRKSHVVTAADAERELARIGGANLAHWSAGVDFGFANPHAFVLAFRTPGEFGTWWIVGEHQEADRTIQYHARRQRELLERWGADPDRVWADPGDASLTSAGEEFRVSGRQGLRDAGFPIVNARKAVTESIALIRRYMARQPLVDEFGAIEYGPPRLFVVDECEHLIRQIMRYQHSPATDSRDARESVIKVDDHGVDAMRYLILNEEGQIITRKTTPGTQGNSYRRSFPMG